MSNEEFEKWAKGEDLYLGKKDGAYFELRAATAFNAWQARQPEIDALNAEILQKSLEGWTEIQRLKAEVERLRKETEPARLFCGSAYSGEND